MNISLNESWINGHYSCGNIDTSMGTVEVFSEEFFAKDEHAWEIICEIHRIWLNSETTQQQAFQLWIAQNF
jgi:hypothetical protein